MIAMFQSNMQIGEELKDFKDRHLGRVTQEMNTFPLGCAN